MEELSFFFGLQVRQIERGTFINQSKYTKKLLKKFGMEYFFATSTSMSSSIKLDKDEHGQGVDITTYRGIIGSLLYLTTSRPNILFGVGDSRCRTVVSEVSSFNITSYSDADYAGCKIDRKSTSGTCQFFGDRLVSLYNKKQTSVATSTAKAEYLTAGSYCAQLLWIQQQLRDFVITTEKTPIFCDNTSAIA
ncbi:uncharacterized mitochondrial protein AtMg00810-like [Impatiens glandulifera]|uniref:uncharacterized mitochondrial protein AtMg00810-like n=1 Tax=Impatiens glandulifera TaxID=253017 RepID=UPI001FB174FE|nr:uncharacterized mitochondrial protein AtMg00810-like [Impatiens glandulifera]